MNVPFLLSVLFGGLLAAALLVPGWFWLVLLAGPCLLASLLLLLLTLWKPTRRGKRPYILVDGSNVMHWRDGTPQIATVREAVERLMAFGYTPGVVFDANAGYLLSGRYLHNGALAKALGLPRDQVMVVPKGTPADPTILAAARNFGARVVTNDRFRDWAALHPEVEEPGFLIRGGYTSGKLWFNISDQPART